MATKKVDNVPEAPTPVPEEVAAPAPAPAPVPEAIAFDTYVVGKFGPRRDRFQAFASYMRRVDPALARRPQAEWEAEYTKFFNRPIG